MGPLAQFILALTNLVRSGAIRKVPQAIKFAEQQFGKVTPLLKKQIEKVFESAKKPLVGKTGKKEGTVLPLVKKIAEKKNEGITSLEDSSPLMDKINKRIDDMKPLSEAEKDIAEIERSIGDLNKTEADADAFSESIGFPKNPKRPGGSLDPATGITRALARRILERKRIQIGKKDPITVFTDIFGESISDVNNLAEEMIEIDRRGGGMKDMDQMLEADGLFDIEIPTNPQKGLTDDELLELIKKTDEETTIANKRMLTEDEIAELDMDIGGLEYTNDFDGTVGSANKLRKERADYEADMFIEYKKGKLDPVAGDKSLARKRFLEKKLEEMEASGDTRLMTRDEIEELSSFDLGTEMDKAVKKFNDETLENSIILNNFNPKGRKPNATGGRVRAASGGLADLLKL